MRMLRLCTLLLNFIICAYAEDQQHAIVSDRLEISNDAQMSTFTFHGNVKIQNESFTAVGDKMVVYAKKQANASTPLEAKPKSTVSLASDSSSVERIAADGNVRVDQTARYITAGHADIYPVEGKIVFTDDPVIHEQDGIVSGKRITMYQDSKKVIVDGEHEERPTVILTNASIGTDKK